MQYTTIICIAFMATIISSSPVKNDVAQPDAVELRPKTPVSMNATVHHQNHINLQDINQPAGQSHHSSNYRTILSQPSIQHNEIWRDCSDIVGYQSGVYTIQPFDNGDPFAVYCDMDTEYGGWTVFQRRQDGSLDFLRYWSDYKNGFGNPAAEFWLGNDNIYRLTNQGRHYKLRVDLEDFEGETRYAEYDTFVIGDDFSQYKLVLGEYSGDAGDSLSYHNGQLFTTRDRDNDLKDYNCATQFTGAWWYNKCHTSNLNGQYLGGETEEFATGVNWNDWKGYYYSLKNTEMKIRPINRN